MQRVSTKPWVFYTFSASIIALIGALFLPLAVGGIGSSSMMSGFEWIGLSLGTLLWFPLMVLGAISKLDFQSISTFALMIGIIVCCTGTLSSFIITVLAIKIEYFRRLKFLWVNILTLALGVIFLVRNLVVENVFTTETIGIGYFFWLAGLILTICSQVLLSRRVQR